MYASQRTNYRNRELKGNCLWSGGSPAFHRTLLISPGNETGVHGGLPEAARPEITSADLAPLALELAVWGVQSPAELQWLDTPPDAAYGQAQALLRQLGGLDDAGRITPFGRRMNTLGVHPRLASMLLRAAELGLASYASMLAALLQEPAGLRSSGSAGAGTDLRPRVEALLTADSSGMPQAAAAVADGAAVRRMLQESRQLRSALGPAADPVGPDEDSCGLLLSFAYQIGRASCRERV